MEEVLPKPRPFELDHELAREAGRKGGNAVLYIYGRSYFREIGINGGNTLYHKRGKDYFAEIGRRGGLARAKKIRKARDANES